MCTACCAIQNVKSEVLQYTLRIIYFAHIYSKIVSNGITLGGNSSYNNKVFITPKKVIGIIMNTSTRDTRRKLFKDMKMMYSQYIYSLILFTANNKQLL